MKTGVMLLAVALIVGLVVFGLRRSEPRHARTSTLPPSAAAIPPAKPMAARPAAEADRGFLYGRITTFDGATYEGRLRFGGIEEAFWSDYFNGSKKDNPWAVQVPPGQLPKERFPIKIFGFPIGQREREIDLRRFFMARFGDIARIEARGVDVQVTLKSGTAFDLDRLAASDFDDGVRVWDGRRGVVDLDSLRIHTLEFRPTAGLGESPRRLHGTVHTLHGNFTGFVQWDRQQSIGPDELAGHAPEGDLRLPFDTLRSITRQATDGALATLLDGREILLSGSREVGPGNRGIYVDDPRYGRVLVSWDAFVRVDFSPSDSGPAYDGYPPGRSLTGSVTTRAGRRLTGRLVFDLDESETTETLDAPLQGVDYTIPFDKVVSVAPAAGAASQAPRTQVILDSGEELQLERSGDLGPRNAGLLIFVAGSADSATPEYVPWSEVERVDFDRPPQVVPGVSQHDTMF